MEGDNKIRVAPDVMVVFGRPKGHRGSYRQWEEDGIASQVVFEVLSPGNTLLAMGKKLEFYDFFGIEEYYLYDPQTKDLGGWLRGDGRLRVIEEMAGWISPRLGIRFEIGPEGLELYRPDGQKFETYLEVAARAEHERQRAERLAARLRELGVEPEE